MAVAPEQGLEFDEFFFYPAIFENEDKSFVFNHSNEDNSYLMVKNEYKNSLLQQFQRVQGFQGEFSEDAHFLYVSRTVQGVNYNVATLEFTVFQGRPGVKIVILRNIRNLDYYIETCLTEFFKNAHPVLGGRRRRLPAKRTAKQSKKSSTKKTKKHTKK